MRLFLRLMHYLLHPVAGTLFSLGWKSGQRMIPPSPTAKAPGPASASLFKDNLALLYQKDRLPLLYQGLLTGAVRVQVGRQPVLNADALRKRTKAALEDVERDAVVAGYDRSDVRDTHFAVVAFLDAVVLNSVEPMRAEWERQTLQQDLFGQADAGIVFFERLNHFLSRRDSLHLADVLEVYLLCLQLGFEGRYSGSARTALVTLAERVRSRIETIRGNCNRLSPAGLLPRREDFHAQERITIRRLSPWITPAAVAFTLLLYLVFKLQLSWMIDQITRRLY
jgi:type VI secretion system protein ImpK